MDSQRFVSLVCEQSGLADELRAEACAQTTLELLGERLSGGAVRSIAAHLPERERAFLSPRPDSGQADGGDVEDLSRDLAQRAGLEPADADSVLAATVRAIVEAVGDTDELERVRAQLPPDLALLFGRTEETGGRMRSSPGASGRLQ